MVGVSPRMRHLAAPFALTALLACGTSGNSSSGGSATGDGDGGVTGGDGSAAPLATAPLSWNLDGTPKQWNEVAFMLPPGWTTKESAAEVVLTAPTAEGNCVIDILAPRPAAAGEAAQRAQLWTLAKTSLAGHTLADRAGNNPPTQGLTRGAAPLFSFVGLDLMIDQGKLETRPYLAVFGGTAVPVAPIFDPANGKCFTSLQGEAHLAEVFHTLTLAGAGPAQPIAANAHGDWTLASTNVVEMYTLQEGGSFIFTLATDFSGNKKTTQSTGPYVINDNIISFFPGGGPSGATPYSEYVRIYEETDSTVKGGVTKHLCLLGAGEPATTGLEVCFSR